jgi:HPt (histidine-containing phosphotransfer) domain-containing protein
MSPLPEEVLDQRMVGALRDLGPDRGKLLQEMVQDFVTEVPLLVAEIDRAVEHGAYEIAARAAHRLNGCSGHLGAVRLSAAARDIETWARTGGAQMASAAAITRTEMDLAITAVNGLVDERNATREPYAARYRSKPRVT